MYYLCPGSYANTYSWSFRLLPTHASGTSHIDANEQIASTLLSSIPDIPDKGKGPARKFSLNLFRRKSVQLVRIVLYSAIKNIIKVLKQIQTRGPNIEARSLTIVQDFAVPSGGLGNTFQCVLRNKTSKKEKVKQNYIYILGSIDNCSGRCQVHQGTR